MTVAEARAFIERAEKQASSEIDAEKVAEALEVLGYNKPLKSGQSVATANPWLIRAIEVAQRAGIVPRSPEVRAPLEGEGPATPSAFLPRELTSRMKTAAKDAGVSDAEVEAFISQYNSVIADDPTGAGATFATAQAEAQIADWQAQALAAKGRPIGVPSGYEAIVQEQVAVRGSGPNVVDDLGRLPAGSRAVSRSVDARYFEGDEFSPAGLDPAHIARLQAQLVAAGLLEEGEYWAGFWDGGTSNAYKAVLGFSNQQGRTADDTLRALQASLPQAVKDARARKKAMETFQAPPYMKPDPAALAQDVKEAFRKRLGRDPTPEDMAAMTATLGEAHFARYNTEVAAARAAFDAGIRAGESGQPQTVGTFQDVDPASRFAQEFERRYQPEINRLGALDEVRFNQANALQSLSNMSALIGG